MFSDLRNDQRIIVYVGGKLTYNGLVENLDVNISCADFYLLDNVEDADVIAIL